MQANHLHMQLVSLHASSAPWDFSVLESFAFLVAIPSDASTVVVRSSQVTTEPASSCVSASSTEGPQLTATDASTQPSTAAVSLIEALMKDDRTDHLTARRQAKQLAEALQHIDAQLRALQVSELPAPPSKAKLMQLLSECQR